MAIVPFTEKKFIVDGVEYTITDARDALLFGLIQDIATELKKR